MLDLQAPTPSAPPDAVHDAAPAPAHDAAPASEIDGAALPPPPPDVPACAQATRAAKVPLRLIRLGRNPRQHFLADDHPDQIQFEATVKRIGVIQSILLRPIEGSDEFELVAGNRRYNAAWKQLGPDYDIPALIRNMTDEEALAAASVENQHRENVSAAEDAQLAAQMLAAAGNDKAEAARLLGWSPRLLAARLCLLSCTPAVMAALTRRDILLGHAELLSGVAAPVQDKALAGVLNGKVTVATLKGQLGQYARRLADAIFDTAQCSGCPHNSALQSGLFDESIGAGHCQHPSHYEELTKLAVEAKADALREQYRVVRIYGSADGFKPLPVSADGNGAVGAEEYQACRSCKDFGCAVSNLPGSQGSVTESLCFDVDCNGAKQSAWKAALARAEQPDATALDAGSAEDEPDEGTDDDGGAQGEGEAGRAAPPARAATSAAASNQPARGGARQGAKQGKPNGLAPRIVQHREGLWRKWLAKALMQDGNAERNARVLAALALSGFGSQVSPGRYAKAAAAIAGAAPATIDLRSALAWSSAAPSETLGKLQRAIAGAAAYGVAADLLPQLMAFMEIEEEQFYTLDKALLDNLTKTELDALAGELGLRKRIGAAYAGVRDGKRDALIAALLGIKGLDYAGLLPAMLRYPRKGGRKQALA